MSVSEIIRAVRALGPRLVEVTGGEPLAQEETRDLLFALCDAGFEVMLETSGAFPIDDVDSRVRIVMDIKCPGSGMADRMHPGNLAALSSDRCEVKFVIVSKEDFEWASRLSKKHSLASRAGLLVSPAHGLVTLEDLADWILLSSLPMRLQPQLHRLIWPGQEGER